MVEPTVSVVIPTYYRNDDLRAAIRSATNQTYESVEVVVVDDSGELHAAPTVEEFDAEYLGLAENLGPMAARNRGIERATGKYVHLLDDDDQLLETCLEKKVSVAQRSESTGVVYAGFDLDGDRQVLPQADVRGDVLEYALKMTLLPCIPSTMLVDRETLLDVDLAAIEAQNLHNEHGLTIELAQRTEYDFVNEVLTKRNVDDDSLGKTLSSLRKYQNTLQAYDHLYEEFPPSVERTARAYVYLKEGQVRVNNNWWSWRAVKAFALAAYYRPEFHPVYVGSLLASLGGRPLYRLGLYAHSRIFTSDRQYGKSL